MVNFDDKPGYITEYKQLIENELNRYGFREREEVAKRRDYLKNILGHDPLISGEEPLDEQLLDESTVYDAPDSYGNQMLLPIPRIDSSLRGMQKEGFNFLQDWSMDEPRTPDRIIMPSGRIMDIEELESIMKKDSEAEDAWLFYYDHVRRMDIDERENNFPIYSFVDEQDIENCKIKYGTREKLERKLERYSKAFMEGIK